MSLLDLRYEAPTTVAQAVELLRQAGGGAKILAGGQSLLPALNLRLSRPDLLVDISRIPELQTLDFQAEWLSIGAGVRHRAVARSPVVQQAAPMLARAAGLIGHEQIRTRGTIGGSLAHGDPAAEYVLAAVILGAELELCGPGGTRRLKAEDFFIAPLITAAAPDEILVRIHLPLPLSPHWGFVEHKTRTSPFPLVTAAAILTCDDAGRVVEARGAVGAVDLPRILPDVSAALAGRAVAAADFGRVARVAAADLDCEDDHQASKEYRRHLAAVYLERALRAAADFSHPYR